MKRWQNPGSFSNSEVMRTRSRSESMSARFRPSARHAHPITHTENSPRQRAYAPLQIKSIETSCVRVDAFSSNPLQTRPLKSNHHSRCMNEMDAESMHPGSRGFMLSVCLCWAPVVQWWLIPGRAAQCCSSVMNTLSRWRMETWRGEKKEGILNLHYMMKFLIPFHSEIFLFSL